MIRIVEVVEIDNKKYVALEDYQKLLGECEKLQPALSNAEIIAAAGEDEVYE